MKKIVLPMLLSILFVYSFGSGVFAASVDEVLSEPEQGWNRYDDADPLFKYTGEWRMGIAKFYYNTNSRHTNDTESNVQFDFKGTKLRLIAYTYSDQSPQISITIDGKKEEYSLYRDHQNSRAMVLVYEKTGLANERHSVTIQNEDSGTFNFDAIDIDGELLEPNTPIPDPTPQPTGERAILTVTMTTGLEKEFDLSISEVNDFINWYDTKENGSGPARYGINKHNNNKGPFTKRVDYVIFKNILSFEVDEYTLSK